MNMIETLEKRIKELEAQKGKHPAIDAGIQMNIDEIKDRLSYLRAGKPDPYGTPDQYGEPHPND